MHRILEYNNHLTNVLTVSSDKKLYNSTAQTYSAQVISTSDYYPFGLAMYGRKSQPENYRFGFNGKENDTEYGSSQLVQDYGFRIYNPSIARFLSVDPLAPEYPWFTPYQFAGNSPIANIDLDGLENYSATRLQAIVNSGTTKLSKASFSRTRRMIDGMYNEKYWSLSKSGYSMELVNRGKKTSPSKAVMDIFKNPSSFSCDCLEYTQLMQWYIMIKVNTRKDFDNYMLSQGETPTLRPDGSTGIMITRTLTRYNASDGFIDLQKLEKMESSGQTSTPEYIDYIQNGEEMDEDVLNDLPIGTRIAVTNLDAKFDSPMRNENAIKVGVNKNGEALFKGHPFKEAYTLQELKEKVAKSKNTQNVILSIIQTYDYEIPDKEE